MIDSASLHGICPDMFRLEWKNVPLFTKRAYVPIKPLKLQDIKGLNF